jgi:hypothetical protein
MCCVVWYKFTDVSEVLDSSIIGEMSETTQKTATLIRLIVSLEKGLIIIMH